MQTRGNTACYTRQVMMGLALSPTDRLAIGSPLTSHSGVIHSLATLLSGGTLYIIDPEFWDPESLLNWLHDERVSILFTVPTLFRRMVENGGQNLKFPTLRLLRLTGEAVTPWDYSLYQAYCTPQCVLSIGYGATEVGGISQAFLSKETPLFDERLPVGQPVEGLDLQLRDQEGQKVGLNASGEIVITSDYLSPGYWGRPDLTALAFSGNPDGRRTYHTGDLGMLRDDGSLVHLGRLDSQVQIRGQRVEISEIENTLLSIPAIKEAAVTLHSTADGKDQLIAYLVMIAGQELQKGTIQEFLAASLPIYMIPTQIIPMQKLPITRTGKVDRAALPEPQIQIDTDSTPLMPSRNRTERLVTGIWIKVLDLNQVGIFHKFLDLGGDSLRAAQVINAIRDLFEIEISIRDIMNVPTIAGLAQLVDDKIRIDFGEGES